jgi:hypothetical protein
MTLRPVRGIDLSPGPAFVWWQLLLGAMLVVFAVAGLSLRRLRGSAPGVVDSLAVRIALFAVVTTGAAVIVRSFRSV